MQLPAFREKRAERSAGERIKSDGGGANYWLIMALIHRRARDGVVGSRASESGVTPRTTTRHLGGLSFHSAAPPQNQQLLVTKKSENDILKARFMATRAYKLFK